MGNFFGATFFGGVSGPAAPVVPVGRYASQSDIENQFGLDNVRAWSQLDNSVSTADANRIQHALDYADARIISAFANLGNYATPLAPQGTEVALVTRWAAVIAGAWLYQSRGIRDADPQGDHIARLAGTVEAEIATYKSTNKLNATRRWPTATSPSAW